MRCEIIQDLLPLYIDGLVSEESNREIEEHLRGCEACQRFYEEMSGEIGKELEKSIMPEEKGKIHYLRKIKKRTMIHILTVLIIIGAFAGGFYFLFGVGMKVKQSEVEITAQYVGTENWELNLKLNDGEKYDLLVVQDPQNTRMIEKEGEICWEHIHEVKKVLHNPLDDVGDTMSIGGHIGDGSRHIFQFEDQRVIYEDGKIVEK